MHHKFMLILGMLVGCGTTPTDTSATDAADDTIAADAAEVDGLADGTDAAVADTVSADAAPDVTTDMDVTVSPGPCDPTPVDLMDAASPSCPFYRKSWPCADLQIATLAKVADGGFALAGTRGGVAWLGQTDALGHFLWQRTLDTVTGGALDVAVLTGGGLAVTGGDNTHGWVWRTDATGATVGVSSWVPAAGPGHGVPARVAATLDGGYVVAGTREAQAQLAPWLWRLDDAGKPLWEHDFPGAGPDESSNLTGFAATSDGGFAFGHTVHTGAGTWLHEVVRVDSNGTKLWAHDGGDAIAADANGAVVTAANSLSGRIYRLDAAGAVTWSRVATPPVPGAGTMPTGFVASIVALPGGEFALLDSTTTWQLQRLTSTGALRWTAPLAGNAAAPLVATANGMAFVTAYPAGGTSQALVNTDPWANTSCTQSAGCAAMGQDACSDANPCSGDACVGGQCTHAPFVDWTNCGPGAGCADCVTGTLWCTSGKCG